jgi:hypothetical protein
LSPAGQVTSAAATAGAPDREWVLDNRRQGAPADARIAAVLSLRTPSRRSPGDSTSTLRLISRRKADIGTLIWLLIWFIADLIEDNEPLLFDPVNLWTGKLILAIGLDLASLRAVPARRTKR